MNMIGKEIDGRYEILEEIGKGGMAHVYKSRDKSLNRLVAVKVLKEDYKDDKEFVRRFNVEAQAAASLSNPHIVSIYDVGCENGMHYIVMEYIEGETLKEYIDRVGVLPWREAANYSIQICEGIEEAHNNSVIHRDIKPQNIIMASDGVLKVTDFGIARASTQATMTMANNNTIGTAHYLSPEQARGGYTDERTDIYSMGVVMYEMLTGQLPFDDNSPVAIAIKHLQETATPITDINPDVPNALEQIVMKAMSKEQDSRYSFITDMISDIKKVLANPNVNLFAAGRRSLPVDNQVNDAASNTIKMPRTFVDSNLDEQMIPGYDLDDYDEQDEEYEAMERLNEKRAKRLKKKKERKIAFIAFLSALAVLAVGFAAAFAFTGGFGIFGVEKDSIQIPNVVGMTIKDAQSQYGKSFSIIEQNRTESTKPAGTILEQTPAGGDTVSKRDNIIIRVVVSLGSSSVTLDDYTGIKYDKAKEELEKLGLKCSKIEKVDPEIEAGLIISQEPKSGSSVAAGDMITFTVSKGPESTPEPSLVPNKNSNNDSNNHSNNENSSSSNNKPNSNDSSSNSSNNDKNDENSSNNSGSNSSSGGSGNTTNEGSSSGSSTGSGTSTGSGSGSGTGSETGSGSESGSEGGTGSGGGSGSGSESGSGSGSETGSGGSGSESGMGSGTGSEGGSGNGLED